MIEGERWRSLEREFKSIGTITEKLLNWDASHLSSDGRGTQSRASKDDRSWQVNLCMRKLSCVLKVNNSVFSWARKQIGSQCRWNSIDVYDSYILLHLAFWLQHSMPILTSEQSSRADPCRAEIDVTVACISVERSYAEFGSNSPSSCQNFNVVWGL